MENTGHNVLYLNAEGELKGTALPIEFNKRGIALLGFTRFTSYDDKTLLLAHPDPIVYEISNREIQKRYEIDFGDYGIPEEVYGLRDSTRQGIEFFSSEVKEKGYAYSLGFFSESDNVISFLFRLNSESYQVFYDKINDRSMVAAELINDIDHGLSPMYIASADSSLFSLIQPLDLLNRIEYIRKNHPERINSSKMKDLLALADSLSEFDNPVIMEATLKKEL